MPCGHEGKNRKPTTLYDKKNEGKNRKPIYLCERREIPYGGEGKNRNVLTLYKKIKGRTGNPCTLKKGNKRKEKKPKD